MCFLGDYDLWSRVFGVDDGHNNFYKNDTSFRASGNCDDAQGRLTLDLLTVISQYRFHFPPLNLICKREGLDMFYEPRAKYLKISLWFMFCNDGYRCCKKKHYPSLYIHLYTCMLNDPLITVKFFCKI